MASVVKATTAPPRAARRKNEQNYRSGAGHCFSARFGSVFKRGNHHALHNFYPDDLTELGFFGRLALRRMRRRPALVRSFWKQANLSLELYKAQLIDSVVQLRKSCATRHARS
ncbi:MAG TPA: hypothetical protein VMU41_06160 [Candidatus Binataceae bacterium]|nr:hypothetical protein [Candidatus Binataceae bacterium]